MRKNKILFKLGIFDYNPWTNIKIYFTYMKLKFFVMNNFAFEKW